METPSGLPLVELEADQCRWPIGADEYDTALFCGAGKADTGSYCVEHRVLAYKPPPRKAERRPFLCQPVRRVPSVELGRVVWRRPAM